MARNKLVNGVVVPLSAEEEAEHNALIAAWDDGADARAMTALREERNAKLAASDWTQNRDVKLSNDDEWKSYRAALRDLPKNTDPANPTWPTEPSQ